MPPLSRKPMEIIPAVLLPHLIPIDFSRRLKLRQHLPIVPDRMRRKPSFLRQMPEKSGRLGVGLFAGKSFQAAALARALAVLALWGLRGSRGGKRAFCAYGPELSAGVV